MDRSQFGDGVSSHIRLIVGRPLHLCVRHCVIRIFPPGHIFPRIFPPRTIPLDYSLFLHDVGHFPLSPSSTSSVIGGEGNCPKGNVRGMSYTRLRTHVCLSVCLSVILGVCLAFSGDIVESCHQRPSRIAVHRVTSYLPDSPMTSLVSHPSAAQARSQEKARGKT